MLNNTYTCGVSLMSEVAAMTNPGHLIREQRQALGWSQQAVAELSGVTQGDLSRIENGRLDARWSRIQRIMTVLSDPSNRPRRSLANGGRRTPPPAKSDGPIWRPSGPVLSPDRQVILRHARTGDQEELEHFDLGPSRDQWLLEVAEIVSGLLTWRESPADVDLHREVLVLEDDNEIAAVAAHELSPGRTWPSISISSVSDGPRRKTSHT